jgi:hypothetical protein
MGNTNNLWDGTTAETRLNHMARQLAACVDECERLGLLNLADVPLASGMLRDYRAAWAALQGVESAMRAARFRRLQEAAAVGTGGGQ